MAVLLLLLLLPVVDVCGRDRHFGRAVSLSSVSRDEVGGLRRGCREVEECFVLGMKT